MYKLRKLVGMNSNGKMLHIKGGPHGKEKLICSDHMSCLPLGSLLCALSIECIHN